MLRAFEKVRDILVDLLDVERDRITEESYLVRDLDLESIDFLELAVALNAAFQVTVDDDTIFLNNLRYYLDEADETKDDPVAVLQKKYPFLSRERLEEIRSDLVSGPAIKVKDVIGYIQWQVRSGKRHKAEEMTAGRDT